MLSAAEGVGPRALVMVDEAGKLISILEVEKQKN